MSGWKKFSERNDEEKPHYTEVTEEYAKWSEGACRYALENHTHITFQDAVDALEAFI